MAVCTGLWVLGTVACLTRGGLLFELGPDIRTAAGVMSVLLGVHVIVGRKMRGLAGRIGAIEGGVDDTYHLLPNRKAGRCAHLTVAGRSESAS